MQLEDYLRLPYTISLRPDEDGTWIAEIEELEGCAAHGESQMEALSHLDEAKRLWVEESLSNGQPVPKPSPTEALPSGKWVQRVPRSLHKNLARLAKIESTSLNQLVVLILSEYVGGARRQAAVSAVSGKMFLGDLAWFSTPNISTTTVLTWGKEGTLGQFLRGAANVTYEDITREKVG